MTRNDYQMLAALFAREISYSVDDCTRRETIKGMARLLASEIGLRSRTFKRAQFLTACNVED